MTAPLNVERLVSRRLLVGSSILVIENVLRLGMVAAVSLWIAHRLGPAQFGLLNHASAMVAVFWSAALLGLDTPLTARLATSVRPGLLLGSAFALRTATGVLGGVLALLAVLVLRGDEPDAVMLTAIVALAVPVSAPLVVDAWFKAHNDALAPALARLCATVLSCAVKVGCLLLDGGVVALAWTVALESLLVSVALLTAYRVRAPRVEATQLAVQRFQMSELLRESWPFLFSGLVVAAYMKVDVVMLGVLSTNNETGLYSLSQKLCEVLYIVPVIVVDVLFPQLVRHQAVHGHSSSSQVFFDVAFAVALVATVLAVGFVVVALPAMFGEPYRPTVAIFAVQAVACLGAALGYARFKWMAATGRQAIAPWVALLGLVAAIALHALLIPAYGAMGAAAATVIAFTASGWWASYLFPSLRMAARMQTRALWPWSRLWLDWRQWRAEVTSVQRIA
jgi:O-antigen/teichoic acid export membrane protein